MRYQFNLKKIGVLLLAASLINFPYLPANASRNGVEQKNNMFVVGISFDNAGTPEICSGSLISPTFILTAAHCVVEMNGAKHENFVFNVPGTPIDSPINAATQPKILKTYVPEGFYQESNTELNDLAFIQLDKPLASKGYIKIAKPIEVVELTTGAEVQGYGHGYVYETNETYSLYPKAYHFDWKAIESIASSNAVQVTSTDSVGCSGDSGGPITAKLKNGEEVVIGVLHSAAFVENRCGTKGPDGLFHMQITLINQFINLVEPAFSKSLVIPPPVIPKIYKITCVKGKTKKYFTGTNPKCPSGYKQSAKVLVTK